jgi:hypothetical protein
MISQFISTKLAYVLRWCRVRKSEILYITQRKTSVVLGQVILGVVLGNRLF